MRQRTLLLAAGAGLAFSAGATLLVLTSDHEENKVATLALALTAGVSFIASGLIAAWRRPENRTGLLLAAVGYLWALGALSESNHDWLFTAGVALGSLAFGAFAHLLLAFPGGVLQTRLDRVLVASAYALTFFGSVALLLVDETPSTGCESCRSTIAVTDSKTAADVVTLVDSALGLVILVAILVVVVRRFHQASPAMRRILGPVLGAGALAVALLVLGIVVDSIDSGSATPLEFLFLASFGMVPIAFLAGVLRSRLARAATGDLLLELERGRPLRDALADALHDPSLEIAYWLPERNRFVSAEGKEIPEDSERTAHFVERDGSRIAALLHDPSLAYDPALVEAVAAAAGLWLENERLQADLRAQVHFLDTVVNTSPSLLCALDVEGRIVNFNIACGNASGREDPETIRHEYFWDVFAAPDGREALRERFQAAAPAFLPIEFESTFVDARGAELSIAWLTAPISDEDGNARNIIFGGLDITERKLREVELGRERDFLRNVADATPSLLVVVDRDGTVTGNSVNKSFERTIGWSESAMLGRSFFEIVQPEDESLARIGISAAFAGSEPEEQVSRWRTRNDGERIIAWTATPIVDLTGRGLALVCGVDVTERERREADLRSSEERLRAAIDASPVAIVEYALDDTITRWNPAAERIFGWTSEQVVGGLAKHQPPGRTEELAELFRRVRAGEVYTSVESQRVRKDGAYIDVEISAAPIRDAAGNVLSHMALFADITDRKRHEEEMHASRARIVQAGDEARRVLERNLHDGAQQRLVSLSLTLRLAERRLTEQPAEARELVSGARDELARAIEDLRELARGIHPAVLTDRGLDAALDALASRSPVPVDVAVPAERLPGPVEAAAYYVVAESLTNVAKYARASSASVRVSRQDGNALIEVSDDGIGGADSSGGTGLSGLADRLAALDGTLVVDSPPGGGTRIRAAIPVP
jgi:PAS domain S-box-containing protein